MNRTAGYTSSTKYNCLEDIQRGSAELWLCYCGWEQCEPSHRFGPNMRETYVLHFVGGGTGTLEINGREYHLEKGDVFLIPPETEAWYEADQKNPWFYSWVGFRGLRAKECMDNAGFSLKKPVRRLKNIDYIKKLIEKILEEFQLSYKCELRRNAYLLLILSELVDAYTKETSGKAQSYPGSVYANQVIDYINQHYNEKIRIADLATYIGVNRSYLTSSFKKNTGYSPQEYLVLLRMYKAASLLKNTDMSVSTVAASVGYGDQLAFSKMFKKYYGVSPKLFRESEEKIVLCTRKGEFHGQFY